MSTLNPVKEFHTETKPEIKERWSEKGKWTNVYVNGLKVEVWTVGNKKTGAPTIFLHGWGLSSRSYRKILLKLARQGRYVIAPSIPGFGSSDPISVRRTSLDSITNHILDALEELGVHGPFDIIGHSFGGGVALNAAYHRPDLFNSLTLACPVGGANTGPVPLYKTAIGLAFDATHKWGPYAAREMTGSLLRNPIAVAAIGHVARNANLVNKLATLSSSGKVSVRFLFANKDTVVSHGTFPEQIFGRVSCEMVDGRHSWLLTDPDRFVDMFEATDSSAENL